MQTCEEPCTVPYCVCMQLAVFPQLYRIPILNKNSKTKWGGRMIQKISALLSRPMPSPCPLLYHSVYQSTSTLHSFSIIVFCVVVSIYHPNWILTVNHCCFYFVVPSFVVGFLSKPPRRIAVASFLWHTQSVASNTRNAPLVIHSLLFPPSN